MSKICQILKKYWGENQQQQRYKREGMTTQGEGRHHGVHVFFILQRGIKAAIEIDTKTYMDLHQTYINCNERQPNGNKDNNKQKTKMMAERKDGQI